ncbi:MAG: hypothetical protein A2268_10785 [Candidatus Raymondbacteria bacterium RifOxyA12_full_50_37]|uniref:Uncharacterized protein n=1 Tax=Candidatus Raymondbacteria bacterium RIFOXYD12_FULL_49_13 TaxID=1817890 RepID=A0A1F7F8X4_UNCRA|nr:MAG: hypothetical protein A2268_10785 [Candidatus Raymondbacteria bacterium RifOxyA12_full_50_37]OGJ85448.1 MAG: hypothetical protein A2248_12570 [Candidatus Raymondbacteria bacterium RIFOXYA2_FULL_49_16]OGJ94956.1 MAG: hypothetical protein A2453_08040 [Candidatus Raymondbacteria bacterium RIFOXYC2_FULL_50_21]OGK02817.1 MAG: hypothetical protein A2487_16155 [Candidatus Raymondbacteria bacterium RifOxyC12_full_50_8]OGK03073.1 MAG: hypothetical protein A2519_21530 [Candidatus Raymondbacteria b
MKILLIQPPVEDFYSTAIRTYPLGLLCIASAPKKAGHAVVVFDAMASDAKEIVPVPEKMTYLKEFYKPGDKSPYRLFGHYQHFGTSWVDIEIRIVAEKPDLIGISSLFTPYHSSAMRTARIAQSVFPTVPIVMGGPHVSACGESSALVNQVVAGEGEEAFCKIIGVPYDQELLADRSLVNPDNYIINGRRAAFYETSRGCPYACSFCSVHSVFNKYSVRKPEKVIAEIKECAEQYGIRHFDFQDDSFGYSGQEAGALLKGIIDLRIPDIRLSVMNGICAHLLDRNLLALMRQAGFQDLNLSLASAQQGSCKCMGRPFDSEAFIRTVREASALGFSITAYFIAGLPNETIDDMLFSLDFLRQLPVRIGVSIFYPVPGTRLFDYCVQKKYINTRDYDLFRLSAASVETEKFSRADIMTLFYLSRVENLRKKIAASEGNTFEHACLKEFETERKLFRYTKQGREEAHYSPDVVEKYFERTHHG